MRVDVVGRGIDVTDAIREYAEDKVAKLTRYFDRTQQITLTLTKADHHGNFDVEIVTDVEKHDAFVASAQGDDLYGAIDHASQRASRQLTDFKEKHKMGNR